MTNDTENYLKEGKENGKKINHYQMLEEIETLVETDFCADMDMRLLGGVYTQEEAKQMANLLGQVYSIAHCISCRACQTKYLTPLRGG